MKSFAITFLCALFLGLASTASAETFFFTGKNIENSFALQGIQDFRGVRYTVDADVEVKFETPRGGFFAPAEEFEVALEQDHAVLRLKRSSGRYLVLVDPTQQVTVVGPNHKRARARFDVKLVPAMVVTGVFEAGVRDLELEGGRVRFTVGRVTLPDSLRVELKLVRVRFLAKDVTVFDGEVEPAAVSLQEDVTRTAVTVDVTRLNLREALQSKKYRVRVVVSVRPEAYEGAVNLGALAPLRASGEKKTRNR